MLERTVIVLLVLVALVGVWTILLSEYKEMDKHYFDDPGYKDTENIA